jgi:DNA-binding MarR family transcriptional regulator
MAERSPGDAGPRPQASPAGTVGYLVWRAHLVVRRLLDEALAELGVTAAHVGIAAELIGRGPCAVSDLARAIGMTAQGATRTARQLRELGWVVPAESPGQGRAILLEITGEGREGYRKAVHIMEQVDASMTAGIPAAERERARAVLAVIAGTGGRGPEF